jgi:co-chaperonin GroES (HSP10)
MLNTEININDIVIPSNIKIFGERILVKELEVTNHSANILIPLDQTKSNIKFCEIVSLGELKEEDKVKFNPSQTVLLSEYSTNQSFEQKDIKYFVVECKDIIASINFNKKK